MNEMIEIIMWFYIALGLYAYIVRKLQVKSFYKKHNPNGEILKYGYADELKAIFCAIITPLGIAIIIRDAIFNHRLKKIKKGRRF